MINNTIEILEHEKDTCIEVLSKVLNQEDVDKCNRFMFKTKEDRHYKTMAWQKSKLERLERKNGEKTGGHINRYMYMYEQSSTKNLSSTSTTTDAEPDSRLTVSTSATKSLRNRWVVNMSKKPLMEAQEKLLTHRPNFAITPRCPPIGEYIAAVEQTCQNMAQGEAEELAAEAKAVLKKIQPPKANITKKGTESNE